MVGKIEGRKRRGRQRMRWLDDITDSVDMGLGPLGGTRRVGGLLGVAGRLSGSITNSQSSLKLMSIELVMTSNHLILCHPLLLPPSVVPSTRVFSVSQFFASGIQSSGVSGLISFRIDWLDLLAVQGTLKSPLDCKEIQPVHPKGDQSCVFIGRTDVEAETPILCPEVRNST